MVLQHKPSGNRARDSLRRTTGFTLVELVVSVAISAILLTGLTSAMLFATRALPDPKGPLESTASAAAALEQFATDLEEAVLITQRDATGVAFTVSDRDDDDVPERLQYRWSGTAGDALYRKYNTQSTVALTAGLEDMALAFSVRQVDEVYMGALVEGSTDDLAYYSGDVDRDNFPVTSDEWIGQVIPAPDDDDAVSWRITRLWIVPRSHGSTNGQLRVQLRTVDAEGLPTDHVLDEVTVSESEFESYFAWYQVPFDDVAGLTPGESVCLTLEDAGSSGAAGEFRYETEGGSGRLEWDSDEWAYYDDESMIYWVQGTVSVPGPDQTATRTFITRARLDAQAAAEVETRLATAARLLNMPEALSAVWETTFAASPSSDSNGDGQPDWVYGDGDLAAEQGGDAWRIDDVLYSNPDCTFDRLTTVVVRFRGTQAGGDGARLKINADWAGGQCAALSADVALGADGTQTLTVYHRQDSFSRTALLRQSDLGRDYVSLRLLIDPSLDTVNVQIEGEEIGTYYYDTVVPTDNFKSVALSGTAGDAEFDAISVRVSE